MTTLVTWTRSSTWFGLPGTIPERRTGIGLFRWLSILRRCRDVPQKPSLRWEEKWCQQLCLCVCVCVCTGIVLLKTFAKFTTCSHWLTLIPTIFSSYVNDDIKHMAIFSAWCMCTCVCVRVCMCVHRYHVMMDYWLFYSWDALEDSSLATCSTCSTVHP
jgi:hypothetical protein